MEKTDNFELTYIDDGLKWVDFLKLEQRREVRNGFRNSSMISPRF
jgi:C1A family cysteine protease